MTTRPPFPPIFDSTMVGTGRACPQKLFRQYIEHWKPSTESVHLVAGGAFADGIEKARRAFYAEGKPAADALGIGLIALMKRYGTFQCPDDSAKSLDRMMGALEFYFERYPLGADHAEPIIYGDKLGVEFSFSHPLPIEHPVSGDPILYVGRADMVAKSYGGIFLYDEKTTTSLGNQWLRQWDMRSQFTGYCWALRQFGIEPKGVVVRGVSILKTKYGTAEVISYRADWEIDRWHAQTVRDIERWIGMWKEGYWDYDLDHACNEYGGCAFQRVCKSKDPETWLPTYFHKRVWDPIARQEVTLEEWEHRWATGVPASATVIPIRSQP
jgi:hypothetical protein